MHGWGTRLARGAVVLVVAAVCWGLFVGNERIDTHRLALLTVGTPHIAGIGPTPSKTEVEPLSQSPAPLRVAARRHAAHAGTYSVAWSSPGTARVSTHAGLQVQLLPTVASAAAVLRSDRQVYSVQRVVAADPTASTAVLAVPGVPGAQGVGATVPASSGGGRVQVDDVVTFREGTVAVVELVQRTGAPVADRSVAALARAEWVHLRQVGTVSLQVTSRPLGWSLLLAGGAVVVAAAVVVVPEWAADSSGRRRSRRQHRERQRWEAERRFRGSRARGYRAPSWQQQANRRSSGSRSGR